MDSLWIPKSNIARACLQGDQYDRYEYYHEDGLQPGYNLHYIELVPKIEAMGNEAVPGLAATIVN